MANNTQLTTEDPDNPEQDSETSNEDQETPVELGDLDANSGDDDLTVPTEAELAIRKVAVRRKIEMYWERKRLQEQIGDLDEIDFEF